MNRKNYCYAFITSLCYFLFLEVFAQGNSPKFTISGYVAEKDGVKVMLRYWNPEDKEIQHITEVNNGKFSFSGSLDEPVVGYLVNGKKGTFVVDYNGPLVGTIYLEPTEMVVNLDHENFQKIRVEGSGLNLQMLALQQQKQEQIVAIDSLNKRREDLAKQLETQDSIIRKRLDNEMNIVNEESYKQLHKMYLKDKNFAVENPSSFASIFLLRSLVPAGVFDHQILLSVYSGLDAEIQLSKGGQRFLESIQDSRTLKIGQLAEDITFKSVDGRILHLSDLKNKKVVLLDFWASWCVPCRQQSSGLKNLYRKYNTTDLEIISISLDDKPELWKKAIRDDELFMWTHALSSELVNPEKGKGITANNLRKRYEINGIPYYLIIDKDGIIQVISNNVDEGGEVLRWLDEHLGSL
ncbi:TlpA disulfide reductase family protein [Sphingobacterium deserti]|uniref:Alkyl hydroperoxide reductase/thiol specific antioxidant/Mal allergen n=1 Tax=Sphingobacterium deserti TaxID=1229276 RepID=A0A0B8T719_9SPHI|nr:TlpA disulfide reductase family protein [Sphingobacterium deserti]KGE13335.1 alkyl hydroperoxide reductase/thiol specific antioxidant/Mal allergen [Sphingobacterium deserti]